jgi:hypothetical protein
VVGIESDMFSYPAHASISRIGRGDRRLAVQFLNELAQLCCADGPEVTY